MSDVESLSKREILALLDTAGQVAAEIDPQKLVQTILDTACRMTNSPDGSPFGFEGKQLGCFKR